MSQTLSASALLAVPLAPLAGAALAGRLANPILLVAPTSIPGPASDALDYLAPPEIDVLGGTSAVSSGVATQLGGYIVP